MNPHQNAATCLNAVLCSLTDLPDGGLRVVVDDLRKSDTAGMWQHHTFFTSKDYPAGMLADPKGLSEAELANFGFSVLVRLLVVNGRLPDADDAPDSDAHLTDEQRHRIAALTDEDVAWIDQQLLSRCDDQFRKVAYVVATAMSLDPERQPGIPDVFYAGRVRRLVERGVLEAVGDLSRMRYSEVRRTR
ncbi:DUF3658 domain-containing protein [Stenotrophomonas lactitubi]|jgi:hypothetical protein|uniref:DUF3658 domain-containing protein n=1 Tax=Stenotrophomonas lactitubi TaxID=2045214 RepID=UPI001DA2FE50|nr:DUF3658 domain-containing protein [Stenotrophomonas lactitubi]CAH0199117.1 hypothetical protein SRABI35_01685 [Stenotrophomonas lactitubi]